MKSRFLSALLALTFALIARIGAQETWQSRTSGVTVPLWSVAYGAGQWVAVGEQGTILTSPDGAFWTSRASGFSTRWLVGVAYGTPGGNGLWVAVGENGLILTSPDAITWTARRTAGTRINAVAWGNGSFVAADDAGSTHYSLDGITWNGPFFSRSSFIRGLVYGAPHFVMTGFSGISTTFDGQSSAARVATTPQLQGAAYGRRLYLATGGANTYTSRDAITWTQQPPTGTIGVQGAAFFNNLFVAVGNSGAIATTFDGTAWTDRVSGTTQTLLAIAASPDSIVAVGFAGTILQSGAAQSAPAPTLSASALTEAVGGSVALTVASRGSAPLGYQWRKEGAEIPGATADTLFLANVQLSDTGAYSCVVTNSVASVASAPTHLTIASTLPPVDPVDLAFTLGPTLNAPPRTAALQPDGKTLIGGAFLLLNEGQAQFGLARLTATGAVDTTFKPGAIDPNGAVHAIAVQSDGKVLIGGSFTSINSVPRNRIARLNTDGSLDTSFVSAYTPANTVTQIAVTPDNRILVVNKTPVLLRLNPDGSADPTWITPSSVFGPSSVAGTIQTVDVQSDGRLVIGVTAFSGSWTVYLRRLLANGATDPTFTDVALNSFDTVSALRVLSDGRILIGASSFNSPVRFAIRRYTATGASDPSFTVLEQSGISSVTAAFTSEGRTWLSGIFGRIGDTVRAQLARLNVDGSLDLGYSPGSGLLTATGVTATAAFILPLEDGRALAGGDFNRLNGTVRPYLARLNAQSIGGPTLPAIVAIDSYYREIRAGEPFTVRVSTSGASGVTYTLTSANGTLTGLSGPVIALAAGSTQFSGAYSLTATHPAGTSTAQFFYVRVVPSAPFVIDQPTTMQTNAGRRWSLSVTAGGGGNTYQWFKNGVAITTTTFNPTSPTLTSASALPSDSGDYTVVIRNTLGFATSETVHLGVDETPRFINIATRALAGRADAPLIAGFVVAGPGKKRVMIRAVGPTLTAFGLAGALADPVLSVYNSTNTLIYTNDDWSSANDVPGLASAGTRLGAFTLNGNSADAAGILTLDPGSYTAVVTGKNGATGIALVEVYEDDNLSSRLINLSTRAYVGTDGSVAIPGIVVRGGGPAKKLLIRAVGPGLAPFGVPTLLADPVITLTDSSGATVATNDNWETVSNLSDLNIATARVTFPLTASSKDAALLVSVPSGGYTVQVSGVAGTTGNVLVEVYELP